MIRKQQHTGEDDGRPVPFKLGKTGVRHREALDLGQGTPPTDGLVPPGHDFCVAVADSE